MGVGNTAHRRNLPRGACWLQGGHEKELGLYAEHTCAVTKHADDALDVAKRSGTTPPSGGASRVAAHLLLGLNE